MTLLYIRQSVPHMTQQIELSHLLKLKAKISKSGDLSDKKHDQLLAVPMKYRSHLTKRPGKCAGFEYHFNIVGIVHYFAGTSGFRVYSYS
jgi:hypothetical protein